MAVKGDDRSIKEIVSDVTSDFSALVREELALARTEMRQGLQQVAKGAAFLLIAGFVVNAGFLALVASLVVGLGGAMAYWLSAFMVGLLLAVVGAFLLMRGIADLKNAELKPERTLETLREDAKIVKERGHE